MTALYPLRFAPILRRYLWGGRRLETLLGKPLPPGDDYAESWELCDRGADQSRVLAGPLAGSSLNELVRQRGAELLGHHHPQPRFPLLVKYLDAHRPLSVQVHPDDAQAARIDPPDLGKTEAWVVIDAEPDSVIYAGLKRGFDRRLLEREVARGTTALCLHRIAPRPGDCFFLPAGTVHALGAGLVIAEIQQSSDVTFRLFDWNRVGADGHARPLHIEEALDAIDYERGPIDAVVPRPVATPGGERLVECDQFVIERYRIESPCSLGGDDRCRIVMVLAGSVRIAGDPSAEVLSRGSTALLPAAIGPITIVPEPCSPEPATTLLTAYLP